MSRLYIKYDQKRNDYRINGVHVPHIRKISRTPLKNAEFLDDGCIGEISTLSQNRHCISIPISDDADHLFFSVISESGGGGSYHEIDFLYLETEFENAIDHIIDYFENEHNRSDECEMCRSDSQSCKNILIHNLKTKHYTEIDTSCYDGVDASIYKIMLN